MNINSCGYRQHVFNLHSQFIPRKTVCKGTQWPRAMVMVMDPAGLSYRWPRVLVIGNGSCNLHMCLTGGPKSWWLVMDHRTCGSVSLTVLKAAQLAGTHPMLLQIFATCTGTLGSLPSLEQESQQAPAGHGLGVVRELSASLRPLPPTPSPITGYP